MDVAWIAALAGPIDFDVGDGALEGLDVRYEIERARALEQGQAPTAPQRAGAHGVQGAERTVAPRARRPRHRPVTA
jgi:hypothetical protein